jgi:hypothetical protein
MCVTAAAVPTSSMYNISTYILYELGMLEIVWR